MLGLGTRTLDPHVYVVSGPYLRQVQSALQAGQVPAASQPAPEWQAALAAQLAKQNC